MHVITASAESTDRKASRPRYPVRTLHLIDIENLAGSGVPGLHQVHELRTLYRERVSFGAFDQVVLACNHLALRTAGFGWLDARHVVRSGPDGADLELLDVIDHENVDERFARVVIASGDGAFAAATSRLAGLGCRVVVVSRRCSLSARLALAAHEVIYIDSAGPGSPIAATLVA
jgi:hypothetical protein